VSQQIRELVDDRQRRPATGAAQVGKRLHGLRPRRERQTAAGNPEMAAERGAEALEGLRPLLFKCLVVEAVAGPCKSPEQEGLALTPATADDRQPQAGVGGRDEVHEVRPFLVTGEDVVWLGETGRRHGHILQDEVCICPVGNWPAYRLPASYWSFTRPLRLGQLSDIPG